VSRKFLVPIQLPLDPVVPLEAATKQYVDAKTQSAVQASYQWSTNQTMADPGAGFIRANAAPTVATQLAVSLYDSAGTARVALLELEVGDRIALYYADDLSSYTRYEVSAAITNNANSWVTIPVIVVTTGGTFAPGNNRQITAIWSASSGGGGGGSINEVWIGPTEPTDPNVELWYDTDAVPPPITFG